MKISLLVNYDAAAALALHYLKPQLAAHQLCVFYTHKKSPPSRPNALAQLAEFEALRLAQDTNIFEHLNATCLNDINTKDFERFASSEPDLVLSIRHMSILKDPTIALARLGVINLHSGILPDYKGVMATFWAMRNKASHIGTTLHWIDSARIDQGAIVGQTRQSVNYTRSYFWNTCNLYAAGCAAMGQTVDALAKAENPKAAPQQAVGQYYSYPDQAALNTFAYPLWDAHDVLREWMKPNLTPTPD